MLRMFFLVGLLAILTLLIAVLQFPDNNLHIIACDVGQGDSFIILKGNTQMLIDGGPSREVIDCLSKYLPFWDRRVEVLVLTHPQKDHYSGFINVLDRYDVMYFLNSGIESKENDYQVLKNKLEKYYTQVEVVHRGTILNIDGFRIDVLNPDEIDVANINNNYDDVELVNNSSIVLWLNYNEFDALFTGDVSSLILSDIVDGLDSEIEYLKIPHHGSKFGLSEQVLANLKPKLGIVSVGKNPWGHPHPEIIDLFEKYHVSLLRTDIMGDIEVISDGNNFEIVE